MWKADAEDLLEDIDKELISPSDFTVQLKVRRGRCGCCNAYPLEVAGSGQLLAFVDNLCDEKIFSEPQEYWKSEVYNDLNTEFSDENQFSKLLYNPESP